MALINPFCKKCLEQTSSSMYLCKRIVIKFFLNYCRYSWVCNNGKRVVIELLWTVLSVIFAYFQLKSGRMDPGKNARIEVVPSNSVPASNWYSFGTKA